MVLEGSPDRVVAIDRDRVLDPEFPSGSSNVVDIALELELRCVHADDRKAMVGVPLVPRAYVGKRP